MPFNKSTFLSLEFRWIATLYISSSKPAIYFRRKFSANFRLIYFTFFHLSSEIMIWRLCQGHSVTKMESASQCYLSQPFGYFLKHCLKIHILPIHEPMNIVAGVLDSHVNGIYFFPSFQPLKIIFIIQRARHCL